MTRSEFIDQVTSFGELIEFCNDNGCYICDDVYEEYCRDEYINNNLRDMAYNANDWKELLNQLDHIPDGYDYYLLDGYGDWSGLDDSDFNSYFQDVLEWADTNDIWEEEEEQIIEEDDDDDEIIVIDEPISIGELMGDCSSQLQQIEEGKKSKTAADNEAFEKFVANYVTAVGG